MVGGGSEEAAAVSQGRRGGRKREVGIVTGGLEEQRIGFLAFYSTRLQQGTLDRLMDG
jgi:hypothetical protein